MNQLWIRFELYANFIFQTWLCEINCEIFSNLKFSGYTKAKQEFTCESHVWKVDWQSSTCINSIFRIHMWISRLKKIRNNDKLVHHGKFVWKLAPRSRNSKRPACVFNVKNRNIRLHYYLLLLVSRAFMAGAASQAGDADSSRAPGLTSGLQGSVNVHRGALLLVPQWQCISSFVFYIQSIKM